jgi:hypothetical protein
MAAVTALSAACGGVTQADTREADPRGDGSAGAPSCPQVPPAPGIDFEPTCATFIPALSPTNVFFVERSSIVDGGTAMQAHRFRSLDPCGFDAVISLPGVAFAADADPYQLSTWWVSGGGSTGLLAVVLRRPGAGAVLLAVGLAASADLMNDLVAPLAVTLQGPACEDSSSDGRARQVLERSGVPLSCEDESGPSALRRCDDGSAAYRLVDYPGRPFADQRPAVFGALSLLAPAP